MTLGHAIFFEPMGCGGTFPENSTILDCAGHLNIPLVRVCGASGACGKCVVRIMDGAVSPVTDEEKQHLPPDALARGYRLACCTCPTGDCRVAIPLYSLSIMAQLQTDGPEIPVEPDPVIQTYTLSLAPPSLENGTADMERLQAALAEKGSGVPLVADLEVLKHISPCLRDAAWTVRTLLRGNEIIGLISKNTPPLGLAVDLGTTKIAAYLVDLQSGKLLGTKGLMNPQTVFGGDVISRMVAALGSPQDAARLQQVLVHAINALCQGLCNEIQADRTAVADMVVAANTAMHHLLLGLPVKQLCNAPYTPVMSSALEIKARDIGLTAAPGAYLRLLPNIAGYVGGDHVAMILATDLHSRRDTVLALDIGTNTEICLVHDQRMSCVSCASGPAFEGAHITCGMRVAEGVIDRVGFTENRITYGTVGDKPALGLCGSGIIDLTAALRLAGILDPGGKMVQHPDVRQHNGQLEYVIAANTENHQDVTFTQKDVREVQLAKGAISAGIRVLLNMHGLEPKDISEVLIAGAFGTCVSIQSAVAIGMLPDLPLSCFRQVGNAAGMGARMALISQKKWTEARTVAHRVAYMELAAYPGFNKLFAKAMGLEKQT